jgi:hypothetical protein
VSALDPSRCLSVPGRLVLGPANLGIGYPCGGKPLGVVSRAKLVREGVYVGAHSEARGRDTVSTYGGRFKSSFVAVLTQYDPDVLSNLWAVNTTSPNGYGGAAIYSLPQPGLSLQPGVVAPTSSLLFLADDPANPSTIIYAPAWILTAKMELDAVLDKPYETAFVVNVGLDATNRDIESDLLQNLSL